MLRLSERIADYLWFVRNLFSVRRPRRPADVRATIVVLPGVYEDPSYFHRIFSPLEEAGYDVVTLPLGRMTKPVPDLARQVLADLERLRRATPTTPIVLLAHSRARWWAAQSWQPCRPTYTVSSRWRHRGMDRVWPGFLAAGRR